MMRSLKIAACSVFALATAYAGSIESPVGTLQTQIGGVNGLTQAYILNTGHGQCATCVTGVIAGTVTPTEVNYTSQVFGGLVPATNAPYAGYSATSANVGTMTDSTNQVTFAMINDGTNAGASNNAWYMAGGQSSASQVTIPVGIFGVTDVWAMVNANLGGSSLDDSAIWLTFGATSNSTSGNTTIKIQPANTNSPSNASPSGELQNSVVCVTGCGGTGIGSDNGAVGTPLASASGLSFTPSGSVTAGNTTVNAFDGSLKTFAYSNVSSGTYAGTTGVVGLNDLGLFFTGALLNLAQSSYLVSVQVRDPTATPALGGGVGSGLYLSALTVDSVATPEPGTMLMFLGGLGAVGFGYSRRRKA
jgi:hypothetical protein